MPFSSARFWNPAHDGIPELRWFLLEPDAVRPLCAEAALRALCEFLVCRFDIDPLFKHDFRMLHAARTSFTSRHGAFEDASLGALAERCMQTYRVVRDEAISCPDAFDELPGAEAISNYAEFTRLTRLDRLRCQATLVRRNAAEMARVREFVLEMSPPEARRVLNVGDGVSWSRSFLSHLAPRLQQAQSAAHIVSIDESSSIFSLQREVAGRLVSTNCTFAFDRMDACSTWFADDSFDYAVGSFMFDDCCDQRALLRELNRVVRDGGTICLSGHHLASGIPADDFVHNLSDSHALVGRALAFDDALRLAAEGSWYVRDHFALSHGWAMVLTAGEMARDARASASA